MLCISTGVAATPPSGGDLAGDPMMDVAQMDHTIVVELRYATLNNVTHHPIYPKGTRCLLRRDVALKLETVQQLLKPYRLRLKIWDAYRPPYAQKLLWDHVKSIYVADPSKGRSLHTWGVAVDVTLVDLKRKPVPMPTDFDDFSAAAGGVNAGADPSVATNLRILKYIMNAAGFYGSHGEWWHYVAKDWMRYAEVTDPANVQPPPHERFGFIHWITGGLR